MTDLSLHAEITRVANDLYWQRDEDGHLRDLETFEALFLSAINSIQTSYARSKGDALRTWGEGSRAYEAICNLCNREEEQKLREALKSYRAEKDRFDNFEDDCEVFHSMAAE